jgi:hypothetical protein
MPSHTQVDLQSRQQCLQLRQAIAQRCWRNSSARRSSLDLCKLALAPPCRMIQQLEWEFLLFWEVQTAQRVHITPRVIRLPLLFVTVISIYMGEGLQELARIFGHCSTA